MVETLKFKEYARESVHFLDIEVPELLHACSRTAWSNMRLVLDLGCGDGRLLFALERCGLLKDFNVIAGLDLSLLRIRRLRRVVRRAWGVVADGRRTSFRSHMFDLILCSQVIEHIAEEQDLLAEIRRLLKPEGLLYMSSVIKRPRALWIYCRKGAVRLDPTHIREYRSEEEFLATVRKPGFKILNVIVKPVKYSILNVGLRLLSKMKILRIDSEFYLRHESLQQMRKVRIKPFGYFIVEILAMRL